MSSPLSRQIIGSKASINPVIRSTVKFRGDFKKSLAELIEHLEDAVETEVGRVYGIRYIQSTKTQFKVRIEDEPTGIECIIAVVFEYSHTDVSYGNVHIELVVSEVSKRPRSILLDKYNLLDKERVNREVVDGILKVLEGL